jgi:hypothetical protein
MGNNSDCTSVDVIVFDEGTSRMLVIGRTRPEPFSCEVEGGLTSSTPHEKRDTVAEGAAQAIVQIRTGIKAMRLKRIGRVFSVAHGTKHTSYYFIALASLEGCKSTGSHLHFLLLDTRGANYASWPGIIGHAVERLRERSGDAREPDYFLD